MADGRNFEKSINRQMAATAWPIGMEFGTATYSDLQNRISS